MNITARITEAELKVMEVLWTGTAVSAKDLVDQMKQHEGWNKNTTYTVLTRLIGKGFIERSEPNFICRSIISKEEVQSAETRSLLEKLYDGSLSLLVAGFLHKERLSEQELQDLRALLESKNEDRQ